MLVNFIEELGLYKIIIEQKELQQYIGLTVQGNESCDSGQDMALPELTNFCMSKVNVTDAMRLIVLKKDE